MIIYGISQENYQQLQICRGHHPKGTEELLAAAAAAKSLQPHLILCDPIDSSPPGSPIPGIFQARVLEWSAVAFSGRAS